MIYIRRIFVGLLLLVITLNEICAQKQANVWFCYGPNGLDFNSGYPQLIQGFNPDSYQQGFFKSPASIADENGNLVFYANNDSLWSANHNKLVEAKLLETRFVGYTYSQVIVPTPERGRDFYVFGEVGLASSLRYTRIVYNKLIERYEVLESNVALPPSSEQVGGGRHTGGYTTVLHANGKDVWLLGHEYNSNNFLAYLITKEGISAPVVTSIGSRYSIELKDKSLFYLKFSPNAKMVAGTSADNNDGDIFLETFDFDPITGKLSNYRSLNGMEFKQILFYRTLEFSPNSNLIYLAGVIYGEPPARLDQIYQVNLSTPALENAIIPIATIPSPTSGLPIQFQLATDYKIYIVVDGQFFSIIERPNKNIDPSFQLNSIEFGILPVFPRFNQSYFLPPSPIIEMPNVFTPNGDTSNACFNPMSITHVESATLKIFNRWGHIIFVTSEISLGWDGGNYPTGVYYWSVELEGLNGELKNQKGIVSLVR